MSDRSAPLASYREGGAVPRRALMVECCRVSPLRGPGSMVLEPDERLSKSG